MPAVDTPPMSVVRRLQQALTQRGIPSAVGGSGLLAWGEDRAQLLKTYLQTSNP